MHLPAKSYPDEILKEVDNEDGEKFAVSTLGLWSLRTAFDSGSFIVRTSDMDKLQASDELSSPVASHVETTYLFSQDKKLRERYSRSKVDSSGENGYIRYGKIIEELDAIAGDCSYKYLLENLDPKHFNPETRDYFLVTVSVDRIDFMNKIDANKDMRLSGYMLMAKGSTLMVKIDVLQRDSPDGEWTQKGDALIVFVARNKHDGKAYKVPEMKVSKHDDLTLSQRSFQLGLTIKEWSKDKSLRDMHKVIPTYEESSHYHNYLRQIDEVKRTTPEKVVKMADTEQRTQMIMHGQDRNRHGKMFGGYLMKEAFDISFVTACLQNPNGLAELTRVDQVLFLKPVPVGSIMDLRSKVTLIEEIEGLGKVMRVVTKGYNEHGVQTNNFNFLFRVKDANYERYIYPETFNEILEYHEAKRRLHFERIYHNEV